MKLKTYKIEKATKLDESDRFIIKNELVDRLEECLDFWIEEFADNADKYKDQIKDEAEEDFKYHLLDDGHFTEIQQQHELINVFQEDDPENWAFQRVLIKSWANNKI